MKEFGENSWENIFAMKTSLVQMFFRYKINYITVYIIKNLKINKNFKVDKMGMKNSSTCACPSMNFGRE